MPEMTIQQAMELAARHHRAGQLAQAEPIYRQVLSAQPNHAEALNLLGDLLDTQGRLDEAAAVLRRAIEIRPDFAQAWNNLGVTCQKLGQIDDAIASFQQAIKNRPDFAPAGYNLGELLRSKGRFAEAIPCLEQAARLWPDFPDAHYALGRALHAMARSEEAAAAFARAIALRPDFADALNYLGIALNSIGRIDEAIDAFRRGISVQPNFPEAYSNLGSALQSRGRLGEAIAAYRQAIAQRPQFADAWRNLGIALTEQNQLDDAIAAHRKAVLINPGYAQAHNSLGSAFHASGQYDQAIAAFREAIRLQPDFVLAHYNVGLLLLLNGDFEHGWPEYEWRAEDPEVNRAYQKFAEPKWDGGDLRGRRILVHMEQGLGDTIQFVRYVPQLVERGATVILQVQPELLRLLKSIANVEQLIARGDPTPTFDLRCSLLSLPMLFGTTLQSIPAPLAYLKADSELSSRWRGRLSADRKKIGLAWAGGPAHSNDRNRSIALEKFGPIIELPGLQFISLQKFSGPKQSITLAAFQGKILVWTDELHDFADTAALIDNLDLVITVDTSVAHLAAALGKPVWMLLPMVPDWRWMLARADSPWYPTMRLFRQARIGDWTQPIAGVVDALRLLTRG